MKELMFLTMEADSIKEELYRYFGRKTETPSKAAFYKQRKKLWEDALRNLLFTFNTPLYNFLALYKKISHKILSVV